MTAQAAAALYNSDYFSERSERVARAARVIIPIVLRYGRINSALDVGCGRGEWLKACQENGVARIRGLDGEYVDQSKLEIPRESFRTVDLNYITEMPTGFDLAICLEVAEHLAPSGNEALVMNLIKAAPLVLFSAAVPHQRGNLHVNEQWPKYWQALFAKHNYLRLDVIRPAIWHDARVPWWYQQNVFLFGSREAIARSGALQAAAAATQNERDLQLELVSEVILARMTSLSGLLRELPYATGRSVKRVWRRLMSVRTRAAAKPK